MIGSHGDKRSRVVLAVFTQQPNRPSLACPTR
jgi:hypothetical protein